ncbi:hypothetical protein L7F22_004508 [Adiantum nelumboides]|nr:hypothetical protein [Adiantum nelumboides]
MVDDSTDRGKEGHLIVYVSYLKDGGKEENHVTFVKLIKTDDGGAEAKYHALLELIKEMGLCLHKLVSLAIDGCSIMVGHRGGLIARMRADVPHLLLVHCLAHRENLAASQAVDSFPKLTHLDKLCRSVYTWLHALGKRMDDLKLIEGALDLPELAILRIHSVRWLSHGHVMERMVKVMPALLLEFGKEKPSIYDELVLYANQFYIHLLADVCSKLSVLSCQFQSDLVDVSNISGFADAVLQNLRKKFFKNFTGCGTKYLKQFVQNTKDAKITFADAGGEKHVHSLRFDRIEGSNRGDFFEDCLLLGKELVTKVVENLSSQMQEDMPILEACKLFSPKHYPSEELVQEACTKKWLLEIFKQYGCLVACWLNTEAEAILHYVNSKGSALCLLPPPPSDQYDPNWFVNQACLIRWNLTAGAARPNPQGSYHYGQINVAQMQSKDSWGNAQYHGLPMGKVTSFCHHDKKASSDYYVAASASARIVNALRTDMMDKGSIVSDAINYVQSLKKQVKDVEEEILALTLWGHIVKTNIAKGVATHTSSIEKIEQKIVEVDVSKVDGAIYQLEILCLNGHKVIGNLTKALDTLQYDIVNANVTIVNEYILSTIFFEDKSGVELTPMEIRDMILKVSLMFGLGIAKN